MIAVNEEYQPLSGVRIGVGFEKNIGWGTDSSGQHGITSSDGRLTFSGQSNGHITYAGSKDGYYPSYYDYDFLELGTFGWKPWDPELKIIMRKIENQVPMYVKDVENSEIKIDIPVIGKDVGFDLIAYDWVNPYGNGKVSDVFFYLEKNFLSRENYNGKLTLKFNNNGDGIIFVKSDENNGSTFKLPRFAPIDGYDKEIIIETGQTPNGHWVKGFNNTDNYIFRIRSEMDGGRLVSAMYGKILGPIILEPRREPTRVYLKYYLNPDGTRNLEHAPEKNLFRSGP